MAGEPGRRGRRQRRGRGAGVLLALVAAVAGAGGCGSSRDAPPKPAARKHPAKAEPAAADAKREVGYLETVFRARKRAETVADQAHLRTLGLDLQAYALSHGGKFPADLAQLGRAKLTRAPGPDGQAYTYVPGQGTSTRGANILVYEAKAVHAGKALALRVDGSVVLLTPGQLQAAVAKTNQSLHK